MNGQGRALAVFAALLLLVTPALAQGPTPEGTTPTPTAAAAPEPAAAPEYRVGAGDVLDVVVFGNEDLSRTATVQTNGAIELPLLGAIPVASLTIGEIKVKLTALLAKDYLVNPQVEVKVREYQSQFVIVVGEVNTPGRKPIRGRTRLIDVLVEANGFTPRASGEILVTRTDGTFDGGAKTLRMRLGSSALTAQDQVNLELPLRNGDIVTALPKYYVTVEGEVNRPGRYPLEGDLTVTGAISIAGGLTRFGSSNLKVRRTEPETLKITILEVDLKGVRKGKQKDPPLQPNDVISVSRRLF